MAISKITLPDNTTQAIKDSRIEGVDSSPVSGSGNVVTSGGVYTALSGKQATLVSGTNIKTINNESLLGSGNITVSGGSSLPSVTSEDNDKVLTVVSGSWAAKRGMSVISGTAEPSASVGNNGDIYIMIESEPALVSWSSSVLYSCSKINGYIDNTVWKTSGTYQGMIIYVGHLRGNDIRFTRSASWTGVRYAVLRSFNNANITNNQAVMFSQVTGFTGQVTNTTDAEFDITIPSDAEYLYVYTKSSSTNTAPDMKIFGTAPTQKMTDLVASLFTANKTIGADGTEWTGSSAPNNWCTTTQMMLTDAANLWQVSSVINNVPSGFNVIKMGLGLYSASKKWIKRVEYDTVPFDAVLTPDVCFVHIIMYGNDSNGNAIPISSVPIDNDDIQLVGTLV